MNESIKKTGILFALAVILGAGLYLIFNLGPSPTGEVTLPTEASFSGNSPDGDINQDGEVDIFDLVTVVQNVGKADFDPATDLNKDGKVDQADVDIVRGLIR